MCIRDSKYLEESYRLNELMIGLLFSANTLLIVAVEMLLLNWVRRFPQLRVVGWGAFLACIGFGVLPFGNAYWFCMFSMIVITFGEMFMFPVASGYVAKRSAGGDQGMYMSWYSMTFSAAATIAPLIGTAAYDFDPTLLWNLSSVTGVLVLIGFYMLNRRSAA